MSTATPADGVEESSVARMLSIFDVIPTAPHHYEGVSDGGLRKMVDGSQLLGQAIVAASASLPDKSVRSAHAIFGRTVDVDLPVEFDVDVLRNGRTMASALVTVSQAGRQCVTVMVLLDVPTDDVVRRSAAMPDVGGPADAIAYKMPMVGRQLRLVDVVDANDPDHVGPPVLDAWLHYDPLPPRPDLAKALLAHFTGHLAISTTMRPHAGLGTAQAHDTVSTGVITITIAFHEPVEWDGWILYHHESTQVGAGMSYVRGQIFTEDGALLASFTQEGMIRPFAPASGVTDRDVRERL